MSKKRKDFFALMVLGPPGSGKGTQVKLLAEKLGLFHLISSWLGNDYIKIHNDPESLRQKERTEKGLLFEVKWMSERVKEKTEEILKDKDKDNCKGIIYDGSPRSLYEAEHLYNFLVRLIDKENIKIIEINVSEEELAKRIKKRLICSNSSKHVFIRSDGLRPGTPCPEGDGVLEERGMDKEEIFRVRIKTYQKETIPALGYLKKHHDVITINGEQDIEDVHREIMKKLNP